jgi:hypothetical protein
MKHREKDIKIMRRAMRTKVAMARVNSKLFLWIVLLVLLILTAIVASATTLVPMSFDELTQRATAIVHARCVRVDSVWSNGEIWTDSRFEILDEVKPDILGTDQQFSPEISHTKTPQAKSRQTPAVNVIVRQLGGNIAGLHSRVEGVPEFLPGEEDYLFLWRRRGEPYRVLGWMQGAFRIVRDPRSGNAQVTQDSASSVFHGEAREFDGAGIRGMPLAAFQQKLHRCLESAPR